MISDSQLVQFFDDFDDPVVCYGRDKRYVYANKAAAAYSSRLPKDFVGRKDSELFGEHGHYMEEIIERVFQSGQALQADHALCFNNRLLTFNTTLKPLSSEGKDYVVGVCRDVTDERKNKQDLLNQKQTALQEIEKQKYLLETIVMSTPFALAYTTLDRRMRLVNHAFANLFGYEPEELLGQSGEMLYARKDDYDSYAKGQLRSDREKLQLGEQGAEIPGLRKNGEVFLAEVFGATLKDQKGEPFGRLAYVRDLTHLKQMQERLEEERARSIHASRLATVGEMAAGVAHEINNPLEIINSCASLVLIEEGRGEKRNSQQIQKMAEKIQTTVMRIAHIVRSLRNISREGSGSPREPVSIGSLVEEVLELCKERFRVNGVEFSVVLETKSDDLLYCQPIEISQVFLNLLTNAFDAVKNTEKPWVKMRLRKVDNHFEMTVADSGPGIPSSIALKIMDPFFTTKELGHGTGLGLSISKGILERHGGSLELLEKEPNTTFRVCVPQNLKQSEK